MTSGAFLHVGLGDTLALADKHEQRSALGAGDAALPAAAFGPIVHRCSP